MASTLFISGRGLAVASVCCLPHFVGQNHRLLPFKFAPVGKGFYDRRGTQSDLTVCEAKKKNGGQKASKGSKNVRQYEAIEPGCLYDRHIFDFLDVIDPDYRFPDPYYDDPESSDDEPLFDSIPAPVPDTASSSSGWKLQQKRYVPTYDSRGRLVPLPDRENPGPGSSLNADGAAASSPTLPRRQLFGGDPDQEDDGNSPSQQEESASATMRRVVSLGGPAPGQDRPGGGGLAARSGFSTAAGPGGGDGEMPEVFRRGPCRLFVLWDLDNKYPVTLDHEAVVANIKDALSQFGPVRGIHAFANYNTLRYVPNMWSEAMEMGMEHPLEADRDALTRCPMCGYRAKSEEALKKHFKQLHEREHKKKFAHKPLAKKYVKSEKHERYQAAIREVLPRRRGFDLEGILRRAGVQVTPVQTGPQKADVALEKAAKELMKKIKVPPPMEVRIAAAARVAASGRSAPAPCEVTSEGAAPTQPIAGELPQQRSAAAAELQLPADAPASQQPAEATAEPQQGPASPPAGEATTGPKPKKDLYPIPGSGEQPIAVLISDDHGFEALLKLFGSQGWGTIVVANTPFKNADLRLQWRDVVHD